MSLKRWTSKIRSQMSSNKILMSSKTMSRNLMIIRRRSQKMVRKNTRMSLRKMIRSKKLT